MTNQTQIRVLLISDNSEMQNQVAAALQTESDFLMTEIATEINRLKRDIPAAKADLILVDHTVNNQPTVDILDDILSLSPDSSIVAVLPSGDPILAQQAILAGARAFVIQPFSQMNLLSTLRRVRSLEQRRSQIRTTTVTQASEATHPVRVITVFSPRGGSGTSTIATNLALSLQSETGMRTLLLDGKLFFGHLDLMLNIRNRNNLADLLPHAAHLDETLIRDVVVNHMSGIEVLLSPSNLSVAQGVRPEDLYTLVSALARLYNYVVIDAGSTLNENTVTLMDIADRVLLVANPELAGLKDASRFIQVTWGLSYSSEKTLVVLNRTGLAGGIRLGDITSTLHQSVFAHIPDDGPRALRSINSGLPLVIRYSRSPASRAIQRMAKELLTMKSANAVSLAPLSEPEQGRREALLASSQFG